MDLHSTQVWDRKEDASNSRSVNVDKSVPGSQGLKTRPTVSVPKFKGSIILIRIRYHFDSVLTLESPFSEINQCVLFTDILFNYFHLEGHKL